jgi:LCP family protein required for cell wall assembly
VDNLSVTDGLSPDWHNILLLGSDTRNIKKVSRTDTIIIASINVNDGRIKLTSIMRDTVVPIPGHGDKKINSASYYGGPELTMKMVNELFKMNITEYVLVNFGSFKEVVDILGGIELDVTKEEMEQVNHSLKEQARLLKLSKETYLAGGYDLTTYGPDTHMDGLQALGYARIRHIDTDFQRTERQRMVINAAVTKMRGSVSVKQLVQLASSMWQYIDTNVNMMSAIGLATTVLKSGVGKMSTGLMPYTGTFTSESRSGNGSALYDTDFAANAEKLHQFIYVDP